ncbi:MAG: carboxylesterase [Planctomycetes bacterium]|nr:carboxylesterase [Planctomycetota bacterium]
MRERTESEFLETVEVGPGPGDPTDASVIWMHGLGADGHDFEPIVPYLKLPPSLRVRFVFPHAPMIPVSLNMGMVMRAWYDLAGPDLRRIRHDEAGVRRSAAAIEALIRRERDRGVPAARIVLCGFSQGGAMALHVGLRHQEKLAGVAGLSSFLILADKVATEVSDANRSTSVLVCHGTLDPMVPEEMGRASRDKLVALGYDVTYRTWPMLHEVCLDEMDVLGRWLEARLTATASPGEVQ